MKLPISLKITLSVVSFGIVGTMAWASSWDGCEAKIRELTKGTKDERILELTADLLEQYELAKCYEYSPTDETVGLIVAIHEGVHFLDLGFDKMDFENLPESSEDLQMPGVAFLFPTDIFYPKDMDRFPLPVNKLEGAKSVLDRYWQREDTPSYKEMSDVFKSFYDSYVEDTDALASSDLFTGGGTEFNAYTHGTLSAAHYSDIKGELISSLSVQRSGMLFFAAYFNAYWNQMKHEQGKSFASASNFSSQALLFQHALFFHATKALKDSRYCETLSVTDVEIEKDLRKLVDSFSVDQVLGEDLWKLFLEQMNCSNEQRKNPREITPTIPETQQPHSCAADSVVQDLPDMPGNNPSWSEE